MTERDISLWRRDQTPRSSTARVSLSGAVIGRAEESESGMFRQKKVARDAWQEKVARAARRGYPAFNRVVSFSMLSDTVDPWVCVEGRGRVSTLRRGTYASMPHARPRVSAFPHAASLTL
jgi:vacuolar-type H+-ATPase catalytic subunit A/Vma1